MSALIQENVFKGGGTKVLATRVPIETHVQITEWATLEKLSISDYLIKAVFFYEKQKQKDSEVTEQNLEELLHETLEKKTNMEKLRNELDRANQEIRRLSRLDFFITNEESEKIKSMDFKLQYDNFYKRRDPLNPTDKYKFLFIDTKKKAILDSSESEIVSFETIELLIHAIQEVIKEMNKSKNFDSSLDIYKIF